MKDFDYYRVSNEEYWGYKAQKAFREALEAEINSTPLTAAERKEKLKEVPSLVREEADRQNEAPRARQSKLDSEFWADARDELDNDYPDAVWSAICAEAYDRGHAYGYSEIYSKLVDITDFVDKIQPHFTS